MPQTRKPRIEPPAAVLVRALPADERRARLERLVLASIRALPASVRSRSDFEVLLVRGTPLDHRRHLVLLVLLAGLFMAVGLAAPPTLVFGAAYLLPAGYGLLWVHRAFSGGEQLERITVDEHGRISRVGSWRGTGTRTDVLKVAVPAIVIVVSGWITYGLVHDIVFAPQPVCRRPDAVYENDLCTYAFVWANATGFTVEQTRVLERAVRTLQLLYSASFFVGAIWFLRRMIAGIWVFDLEPVRGPPAEP